MLHKTTISKPLISIANVEGRLWFVNYLKELDIEDFMHASRTVRWIFLSMRTVIQTIKMIEYWQLLVDIDDISEDVRVRQSSKHSACIEIFLLFTAKKMLWVIKEHGLKGSGNYFIETILAQYVIEESPQRSRCYKYCIFTWYWALHECISNSEPLKSQLDWLFWKLWVTRILTSFESMWTPWSNFEAKSRTLNYKW